MKLIRYCRELPALLGILALLLSAPFAASAFTINLGEDVSAHWDTTLKYVNYFGGSGQQSLNDRDFVAFTLAYTI